MATYSVYYFCNECSEVHPMEISLALDDGPTSKESIGDTYNGKELPPRVAELTNNTLTCPSTKKLTTQKDNNQVFLVPIG